MFAGVCWPRSNCKWLISSVCPVSRSFALSLAFLRVHVCTFDTSHFLSLPLSLLSYTWFSLFSLSHLMSLSHRPCALFRSHTHVLFSCAPTGTPVFSLSLVASSSFLTWTTNFCLSLCLSFSFSRCLFFLTLNFFLSRARGPDFSHTRSHTWSSLSLVVSWSLSLRTFDFSLSRGLFLSHMHAWFLFLSLCLSLSLTASSFPHVISVSLSFSRATDFSLSLSLSFTLSHMVSPITHRSSLSLILSHTHVWFL